MNDQAILEQLALHPRSRAVQLTDRIDMPLDDLQAALVALVAVGDVVVDNDTAPNGQPCHVYELSPGFIATARGQGIEAKAAAIRFRREHPTLDDTALAVAFVRERGTATSAELHALLGLQPEQQASVVLADAVQAQNLVKDGKNWTLGPLAFNEKRQDEKLAPAATAAPTPAPAAAPVVPQFLKMGADAQIVPAQTGTKIERAMEFLKGGSASTGQLRVAIGLRPGQHPSNFLASALVDGRIARDGDYWTLGTKSAADAADSGVKASPTFPPTSAPSRAPAAAPSSTPAPIPVVTSGEQPLARRYRYAIWSDGQVEIQRDGVPLAALPWEVARELADFVRGAA